MKAIINKFTVTLIAFSVAGCSAIFKDKYHPSSSAYMQGGRLVAGGGYSEEYNKKNGLWRVKYGGTSNYSKDLALYRAAELAKKHGHNYFKIVSQVVYPSASMVFDVYVDVEFVDDGGSPFSESADGVMKTMISKYPELF
ncbi:CC0125/CC1285 family lipoprotein [Chromobacterium subtsugae]|uniref:CC0125/CC1285 family lipoprotein n=1 Tax=Chromobacterium subtsugae TaxID=251747 RepID=UPI000A892390|nr:hypothetical protein [Chromobacterium subtsugae]